MDRIRLIASDMDATLLNEQSQLPADFEETIHALAELGIRFAPASGRPLYTLEAMFPTLQNELVFIGDNGGVPSAGRGRTSSLRRCLRKAGGR